MQNILLEEMTCGLISWRRTMADQRKRGGMKQGQSGQPEGEKHQGVRPGSTGTKKERTNKEARKPVVPKKPK